MRRARPRPGSSGVDAPGRCRAFGGAPGRARKADRRPEAVLTRGRDRGGHRADLRRMGQGRPGRIGSPGRSARTLCPSDWPAGWTDWRTRWVLPARRRRPVAVRIGRRVPQTHARNAVGSPGMDRRRRLPYGSAGRRHRLGPPPNRFSRPPVSTTTPFGLPACRESVCFARHGPRARPWR